jgi:hypothetical protein
MEIFLSVIAVMIALSCLTALLVTDAREYRKQSAARQSSSKVKNAQVQLDR